MVIRRVPSSTLWRYTVSSCFRMVSMTVCGSTDESNVVNNCSWFDLLIAMELSLVWNQLSQLDLALDAMAVVVAELMVGGRLMIFYCWCYFYFKSDISSRRES